MKEQSQNKLVDELEAMSKMHGDHLESVERIDQRRHDEVMGMQGLLKARIAGNGRDVWQPIETAPKDGTEVHGWRRGWAHPAPVYFISREYLAREYDDPLRMEEGWYPSCGFIFDLPEVTLEPTHWMPLPEPPDA